jgi:glycosyltransferase involved in cell wall biosynthesis
VDVDVFHFDARGRWRRYLSAWFRIQPRLRRSRYDLVHAQWGQSGLLALPKRLPLVVTYRGGDLHGAADARGRQTLRGKVLQWLSRAVARRADAVLLVSGHMQELLPPGIQGHVIPSGLDLGFFRLIPKDEARRHLDLPLDKRIVLFAGNPQLARKRFALAKEAVDRVNQRLPVELIVAWRKPHKNMPYLMNACDALVFTSQQEGSPNVVKEALACNLPVVSVAVGDTPLRLAGVAACELCPDDRPESIAAALERVLRSGKRCEGRETILDLAEATLQQRVISIYESVLERQGVMPQPTDRVHEMAEPGAEVTQAAFSRRA